MPGSGLGSTSRRAESRGPLRDDFRCVLVATGCDLVEGSLQGRVLLPRTPHHLHLLPPSGNQAPWTLQGVLLQLKLHSRAGAFAKRLAVLGRVLRAGIRHAEVQLSKGFQKGRGPSFFASLFFLLFVPRPRPAGGRRAESDFLCVSGRLSKPSRISRSGRSARSSPVGGNIITLSSLFSPFRLLLSRIR